MISNTILDFLTLSLLLISSVSFLFAVCFPSLALLIIGIPTVATWIFPLVVVIVSPDISRRNFSIQVFGNIFSMLFLGEIIVWQHNSSTSRPEDEGFAEPGRILLLWAGGSLFFIYSMKVAYMANPDTRELHANFFGCPEVVRRCLKALRIHRQSVSDPEYQLLVSHLPLMTREVDRYSFKPQEKPHDFPSELKSRSADQTDSESQSPVPELSTSSADI